MRVRLPMFMLALAGLLGLSAVPARAQSLLFDWVGFDYESPNPNPAVFGEAGSGLVGLGFVTDLHAPLVADTTLNQYTFVIGGLTPVTRTVVGTFIIVDYSPGTMNIYEDAKAGGTFGDYGVNPPSPQAPATFTDGSLYLAGALTNFEYVFNTATGSGSFSALYAVTGGTQLGSFPSGQRAGWTFAGTTANALNIPLGYQHQIVGQNLLGNPVLVRSSSWGQLKASYR